MFTPTKNQVKSKKMRELSANEQQKVRGGGGRQLPRWLEKLTNRTEK